MKHFPVSIVATAIALSSLSATSLAQEDPVAASASTPVSAPDRPQFTVSKEYTNSNTTSWYRYPSLYPSSNLPSPPSLSLNRPLIPLTLSQPTSLKAPFLEQFTDDWSSRWSPSEATKEQKEGEVFSYSGKWSVEEPTVFPGLIGDQGLVLKTKANQHAISAQFDKVIDPKDKPLVVQYEVKMQKGLSCGGAYLKLLTESDQGIQEKEFSDKTPWV